jgi:hypothetical protein
VIIFGGFFMAGFDGFSAIFSDFTEILPAV